MDFVFYKTSASAPVKIPSLESGILDLRKDWTVLERESFENLTKTLEAMRRILDVQLPFSLISEDVLRRLDWPQHWSSMLFVVPQDVDHIHEFSIDESSEEGIDMEYIPEQYYVSNDDARVDQEYPTRIARRDQTYPTRIGGQDGAQLDFFHLSRFQAQRPGKRFFLFMRNFKRTTAAIFRKYKPRLYELDAELNDKQLKDFIYKPVPVSNSDKPVAVIVHGFMSFTEENFGPLKESLVASDEYSQIYGFSYPPNKMGIRDSGAELLKVLTDTGLLYGRRKIDLYAHSEGGLVCRSMIARDLKNVDLTRVKIRHLVTAGTPHLGTPIADLGLKLCTLPNLAIFIANTFIDSFLFGTNLESIYNMKHLMLHNYLSRTNHLGLKDMAPGSDFLADLQDRCLVDNFNIFGSVILASYELTDYTTRPLPIRKWLDALNRVLGQVKHDSVVPVESSAYRFTESRPFVCLCDTGFHSQYYGDKSKAADIVNTVVALERIPVAQSG